MSMAFDLSALLSTELWGGTGRDYLYATITIIVSFSLLKIFKFVIVKHLKLLAKKSKTHLDDLAIKLFDDIHWPFYVFIAFYSGFLFLDFGEAFNKALNYLILIIIIYYAIKLAQNLVDYMIQRFIDKKYKQENRAPDPIITFLGLTIKISFWIVAFIFLISNLGFNITSLVAGMGIGGIAIALALQSILGDIFSSVSIYFDKPFQIGEFIIVGEHMGVVKKIGIKSTRIASLSGEEIIISNKELTTARVKNYKRMEQRRIVFGLGLTYQTSLKNIKAAKEIIIDVIKKVEGVRVDRVHFKEYGAFSLNFEAVYYVENGDYAKYMNAQETINFAIKERFEKEGIEFAYPTQTVFLNK